MRHFVTYNVPNRVCHRPTIHNQAKHTKYYHVMMTSLSISPSSAIGRTLMLIYFLIIICNINAFFHHIMIPSSRTTTIFPHHYVFTTTTYTNKIPLSPTFYCSAAANAAAADCKVVVVLATTTCQQKMKSPNKNQKHIMLCHPITKHPRHSHHLLRHKYNHCYKG